MKKSGTGNITFENERERRERAETRHRSISALLNAVRFISKLLFLNVMMCNHLNSDCGQLDFDGFMNQLNFKMSSYEIVF